jgi:hypothetical protein
MLAGQPIRPPPDTRETRGGEKHRRLVASRGGGKKGKRKRENPNGVIRIVHLFMNAKARGGATAAKSTEGAAGPAAVRTTGAVAPPLVPVVEQQYDTSIT